MFPTTRWTLILDSHRGGEAEKAALEPTLRRLVQSPDYARELREGHRRAAARVAPFDGRACRRLIDLVTASHGASTACLSA